MSNVELTDRDEMLLKCLLLYGVISVDSVGCIYQTSRYHSNRLTRLADARYVNRSGGLVTLGVEGRRFLEEQGHEVSSKRFDRLAKERRKKVSEVGISFLYSDLSFIPSWEAKKRFNLNRGLRLLGLLQNSSILAVYSIGKRPGEEKVSAIKDELRKFPPLGIRRAVILAESKAAIDMYTVEPLGLDEQLLLPYSKFSIELLKIYARENLSYKSAKIALGDIYPSKWVSADYSDSEGRPVVVLSLNDIEKRARLKSYYEFSSYRHTSLQDIIIVCLESQYELFTNEFPHAKIVTIQELDLLNNL